MNNFLRLSKLVLSKMIVNFKCRLNFKHYASGIYKKELFKHNSKPNKVFLDFLHETTHLGDRMFFSHFIEFCNMENIEVIVRNDDYVSIDLFESLKLQVKRIKHPKNYNVRILILPSIINKKLLDNRDFIIDFTEFHNVNLKLHLIENILLFKRDSIKISSKKIKRKKNIEKFIIYSPYVNSGFFRLNVLKKRLLYNKILEMIIKKKRVILVGTALDKIRDSYSYNNKIIDLRGITSVKKTVDFFVLNEVELVVCFDNFFG